MAVYHILARFANANGARLTESFSWYKKRALRVEYLTTGPTVVFAPKGRERLPTVKAIFGILIAHPKILTEQFTSQLRHHPVTTRVPIPPVLAWHAIDCSVYVR